MIRKILGFLPAAWWGALTALMFIGFRADFTDVSPLLWVWFGLSVVSGVLLCFDGILLPVGLLVGFLTNAVSCLVFFLAGPTDVPTDVNRAVCILMGALTLFYVLYTVCYITYHRELNK